MSKARAVLAEPDPNDDDGGITYQQDTPSMSTRILAIGRTGQVPHELGRGRWPADLVVDFIEPPEIDLASPNEARNAVIEAKPAIVVNAAAYTAVDAAQPHVDEGFAINRDGPAALAETCREIIFDRLCL
jgi:dTDP-4-dehydrorhamnose reductase